MTLEERAERQNVVFVAMPRAVAEAMDDTWSAPAQMRLKLSKHEPTALLELRPAEAPQPPRSRNRRKPRAKAVQAKT